METNYQLFYNDGQLRRIVLRAVSEEMAVKHFELLRPDAFVVYVTDDPIPMEPEYVEFLTQNYQENGTIRDN